MNCMRLVMAFEHGVTEAEGLSMNLRRRNMGVIVHGRKKEKKKGAYKINKINRNTIKQKQTKGVSNSTDVMHHLSPFRNRTKPFQFIADS